MKLNKIGVILLVITFLVASFFGWAMGLAIIHLIRYS